MFLEANGCRPIEMKLRPFFDNLLARDLSADDLRDSDLSELQDIAERAFK
jgi:hypothetical protein